MTFIVSSNESTSAVTATTCGGTSVPGTGIVCALTVSISDYVAISLYSDKLSAIFVVPYSRSSKI